MASAKTNYSQRLTNNYIVLPLYYNSGSGGVIKSDCYVLPESSLTQWASDNASKLTVVGNVYTTSVANFPTIIANSISTPNGLWQDKYYTFSGYGYMNPGVTLKDMGKDVYIGTPQESNLLHLRLVQVPGPVSNSGQGGKTGYVFVEGNADIFNSTGNDMGNNEYPVVSVARV
jgi:hypothetical protein